jgi:hypothetical protein
MTTPDISVPERRYAQLAAQREADPARWLSCFEALFTKGLLHIPSRPGAELALHVRQFPFESEIGRIVHFCFERIVHAVHNNSVIGIDLSQVRSHHFRVWLDRFQTELAAALSGVELSPGQLMFSLLDTHTGFEDFLELGHCPALGYPTLAIRYATAIPRCESRWQKLLAASHADSRIKPVPVMALRPLSGLHAVERGECVMPDSLFEVRADTAWLMLEIDATRLGPPAKLRAELSACLRMADNLIEEIYWPRPTLQLDALLNRRVGIHISRLGDLLTQRGMHPSDSRTFNWLRRWLRFVRRCFVHESILLARRRGPFPELGATELIAELTPRYGQQDASRMVKHRSLRHRHLLALSPFTLFPEESTEVADECWLNLIPVIECADALTMYGPDPRNRLSVRDWGRLLQLTGAIGAQNKIISYTEEY